jgi:amino acid transporter
LSWSPFVATIVALALTAWAAFYLLGSPLNASETVIIVGLCAIFGYLVRAGIQQFQKRKSTKRRKNNRDISTIGNKGRKHTK